MGPNGAKISKHFKLNMLFIGEYKVLIWGDMPGDKR